MTDNRCPSKCSTKRDCRKFAACESCPFCKEDEDVDDVRGSYSPPSNPPPKGSWKEQVQRRNSQAQAYISTAVSKVRAKKAGKQIRKWFGSKAVSDSRIHIEILRILNSVQDVFSNVDYVRNGDECSSNTYAYVYKWGSKSRDSSDRFLFYLCDLYDRSADSVQIETLTHEGSHHAVALLNDVDFGGGKAYGRGTCQRLAEVDSNKALLNADNFCYFVQDITDDE